jgi:hypothetical protein
VNGVTLILSQLIPLALGAAVVTLMIPRGPGALPVIAGVGYLLGLVLMTLILRILSRLGIPWNFVTPAIIASLCAASLIAVNRKWWVTVPATATGTPSTAIRVLFWALALLLIGHIGLAAYEAIVRPLYPWDAAAQWATKARVWYDFQQMVPFVDDVTWLGSTGRVFTDAHPTYPSTVPLFETWSALGWGSWNDAVANISWPLSLAALAAAAYGQLQRLRFTPLSALAAAYAIASLPFVDVHAALAGYADLALAAFYALAVLALARWPYGRTRGDVVLLVLCACTLPMLKAPGWAWLATLIAGAIYTLLPRRVSAMFVIGGAAIGGCLLFYAFVHGPVALLGYIIQRQDARVLDSLLDNLYVFANWHLLWIVVPLLILADWRRLLSPSLGALTVVMATGVAFLAIVFFFSSTGDEGVEAYTTLNRALLHFVPALVIYAALVARDLWAASTISDSPAVVVISGSNDPSHASATPAT